MNSAMTLTTSDDCHTDIAPENLGRFLADYTSWLLGAGATCARIEKNVKRIAGAYGYGADLIIMSRHISVILNSPGPGSSRIFTAAAADCGINFDINASLSALSWKIKDNMPCFDDIISDFKACIDKRYTNGPYIIFLTSLANASFCRLFGGDSAAMAIVFLATCAGYFCKQALLRHRLDSRAVFFICAFISSVICGGMIHFGWTHTPTIALATSVLYLIPGVPYLNSASDLIARRYLCAYSRMMDALVLTVCLSTGFLLGLFLMNASMIWQ